MKLLSCSNCQSTSIGYQTKNKMYNIEARYICNQCGAMGPIACRSEIPQGKLLAKTTSYIGRIPFDIEDREEIDYTIELEHLAAKKWNVQVAAFRDKQDTDAAEIARLKLPKINSFDFDNLQTILINIRTKLLIDPSDKSIIDDLFAAEELCKKAQK